MARRRELLHFPYINGKKNELEQLGMVREKNVQRVRGKLCSEVSFEVTSNTSGVDVVTTLLTTQFKRVTALAHTQDIRTTNRTNLTPTGETIGTKTVAPIVTKREISRRSTRDSTPPRPLCTYTVATPT